jgi:hypothetical protein
MALQCANTMSEGRDSLYQFVCRHAEMIRAREVELGAYSGDGPTAEQVTALVQHLRPIDEGEPGTYTPSILWEAYRSILEVEYSWLFPERDPLGEAMTAALREAQKLTANALIATLPEQKEDIERITNLHIIKQAAGRQVALRGNRPSLRLWLARLFHRA